MKKYGNENTREITTSATQALKWQRGGDNVLVSSFNSDGEHVKTITIKGASVESERERFDRVEGRERCKAIAEELNAYVDGYFHKCPECDEAIEFPDGVGDKFKCPHCGNVADTEDYEELTIYDYMDDILDIDFMVNRYKEYSSCSICIGWGGPNIYIDTDSVEIKLYWGNTRESYPIHYTTRDAIDEWAEEYYNSI